MKKLMIATLVVQFFVAPTVIAASVLSTAAGVHTEIQHGGGCRKSSPPGQCCHMQKSVGVVHCH
jgi:hypothetical protein